MKGAENLKIYVDKNALQDYTTKLIAKEKTIFATKDQVGSPLVASTVAGMTDHDKIYVYVGSETGYTSGNWYYWDGSAWVSGGIYNSEGFVLDDTLTSATLPAQAKAVGDKVSQLSEEIDSIITTSVSQNMLNPEVYTQGYMSSINGNITSNADWRTTDYMELKDDETPIYFSFAYAAFRYIFYTEQTQTAHVGDYGSITTQKATVTPPTGARYLRVSYVVTAGNYDYSKQYISYNDYYEQYGEVKYSATEMLEGIISDSVQDTFGMIRMVSPDGKAGYSTISEAVSDSSDGDVVLVFPGSYYEAVAVGKKSISIIGVSKADCILWNDYGDYDQCPLYMCAGYLKNMTLKAVQKPADEGKTSDIPYCIHIDKQYPTDSSKRKFEIDNCDFYSDWSDCLGCGTADNAELFVRNCYIENTSKSFRYPFAYHNTTSASTAKVTLENNRLVNNGTGAYCLYFHDYNYESLTDVELNGNTCSSVVSGVTDSNFVLNANNNGKFTLDAASHGNNIPAMNAQSGNFNQGYVVTSDRKALTLDGSHGGWTMQSEGKFYSGTNTMPSDCDYGNATSAAKYASNLYPFAGNGSNSSSQITDDKHFYGQGSYYRFWVYDSTYTTLAAFVAALDANPITIIYPTTSAQTICIDVGATKPISVYTAQ